MRNKLHTSRVTDDASSTFLCCRYECSNSCKRKLHASVPRPAETRFMSMYWLSVTLNRIIRECLLQYTGQSSCNAMCGTPRHSTVACTGWILLPHGPVCCCRVQNSQISNAVPWNPTKKVYSSNGQFENRVNIAKISASFCHHIHAVTSLPFASVARYFGFSVS